MPYLQPAEYDAYGLAPDTSDDLVATASALIEGHCRRPSLLATAYVERVRLAAANHTARLSYGPLAAGAVTAVRVRYGRTAREGFGFDVAQAFALPGTWTAIDPATVDVYLAAREISFATNVLGLVYDEAEITYTAGFTDVPPQVKAACAQIVRNAQTTPGLNVKSSRMDTLQMQYFGPTLLDDGVRSLLKPYVAEKVMKGAGVRLADALLRSAGGETVLLRLPAPAVQGDAGEQLGLATPQFHDTPLGPAALRKVRATAGLQAVTYELLVSASAVHALTGSPDFNSAGVLFASAAGVLVAGTLLQITAATSAEAFGEIYLYRLGLRGPASGLL